MSAVDNHVLKHEEALADKLAVQSAELRYTAPGAVLCKEAADAIFSWLKQQT
jgi:hypothetical protein